MSHRHLANIVTVYNGERIEVIVIDQKYYKIVYESVSHPTLIPEVKKMLLALFGNEIMFVSNGTEGEEPPPAPDKVH